MTDPQNPAVPPADGSVPPAAPPPAAAPAEQPYTAAPAAYATPQPAYTQAPPPAYAPPASGSEPGKGLGIAALVIVFFFSLVGLILGYVARSQSKKAGVKNTPATVAIVLGWIFLVLGIIFGVLAALFFIPAAAELARTCLELGPGVHTLSNGVTITCGSN